MVKCPSRSGQCEQAQASADSKQSGNKKKFFEIKTELPDFKMQWASGIITGKAEDQVKDPRRKQEIENLQEKPSDM